MTWFWKYLVIMALLLSFANSLFGNHDIRRIKALESRVSLLEVMR